MSNAFLYYQVHGVKPARRSPRRRAGGRGPARSWKYRVWIRSLACAVCETERLIECAHTGDHGSGQKASDYQTIPLCAPHHRTLADSYHVLGREKFEQRHGLDLAGIVKQLNHAWFAHAAEVK